MQILISPEKYQEHLWGDGITEDVSDEIKRDVADIGEAEVKEKNIGPGADLFVYFLVFWGLKELFLLGDTLEKNIDAWIKIGKRLQGWRKNKELVSVDIDGARCLAVSKINEYLVINKLREVQSNYLRLSDFTRPGMFGDGRKYGDLIAEPHGYYTLTYEVNTDYTIVVGVTSKGEATIVKCFDTFAIYSLRERELNKRL